VGFYVDGPKVVPYGARPLPQPFNILLHEFVNISIKPFAQIVTIILQDQPLMAAHVSLCIVQGKGTCVDNYSPIIFWLINHL